MNQHTRFNLPLCLAVEEDAFSHADEIIANYLPEIRGQKTLIISEQFLLDTFKEKVEALKEDFNDAMVYAMGNADFDEAVAIAKKVCIEDYKIIVGFGGGRVLDTAKYAAFVSRAVYICLPTTLSNDSLASPFSVLGTVGSSRKTLPCKIPTAIVVDTDMIINAPVAQTMSGIGDTLAKHSALYDWKLAAEKASTHIDDFAYAIARMSFDSVYHCDDKNMKSQTFIRILSRALVMGGLAMEIAGSSRPCSGSEHLFGHALEEYYPELKISHGIGVALGSVGACVFQGRDETRLMETMKTYGIDLNPMSYGITKDIFADVWAKAPGTRPGRITILDSTQLNREWLDEIYDRMVEAG
ncbi:MAG: iron-containing alcohol dehydrogenase family protein [Lachnospiraceae bacterium]|nr:iron-containing alcohol dehydrogenase family protein [Lachnospiraceae bacterium]